MCPRPHPAAFEPGMSDRVLPGYSAPFVINPCVIDGRAVFIDDFGERTHPPAFVFDATGAFTLGLGLILSLAAFACPRGPVGGVEWLVLGGLGAALSIAGILLLRRGGQTNAGTRSESPSRRIRLLIVEPAPGRLVEASVLRRPLSVLTVAQATFDAGGPFEGALRWTFAVAAPYRAIYARLRWETWMIAASSSEDLLRRTRDLLGSLGAPVRQGPDLAGLGGGRMRYEPVRLRDRGPDRIVNSADLVSSDELLAILSAIDRRLGR